MCQAAIRVLVVDDQTLIREGLASLLMMQPDLQIVGKAADGRAAIELAAAHAPDVVLMDVRMPGLNGIAATREIHRCWPAIRIIVLTTFDDDEYVYEALRAGAAGYLLKNADPDHLARAIRAVYAGQSILDPAVTQKVIQHFTRAPSRAGGCATAAQPAQIALTERLTDRERAVLRGMVDGLSNGAIAEQLSLSEGTVKNHLTHIFQKLDVKDRVQAVRRAIEWGLLHE
jgi:DNA-binding NarL/FixJ family response regulator